MQDKHQRSLVKALTWRVIASLTTMVLVYIFTKEWKLSLGIGVLDVSIKLLFYYLHERGWNKIKWGKH